MSSAWVVSVCVCVSMFLAGCGSDDGGTSCTNTPACGGKIVGTWKVVSACEVANPGVMADCAGETSSVSGFSLTGTITFNGDLTYSSTHVVSSSSTALLPQSCLEQQAITCEGLSAIIRSTPMPGVTASCSVNGLGGCTCNLRQTNVTETASGTYSTNAAGQLTQSPTGGASTLSDYCVRGSTLTLSPHNDARFMSDVMGTITLTK
jgi:hypothetical protein